MKNEIGWGIHGIAGQPNALTLSSENGQLVFPETIDACDAKVLNRHFDLVRGNRRFWLGSISGDHGIFFPQINWFKKMLQLEEDNPHLAGLFEESKKLVKEYQI